MAHARRWALLIVAAVTVGACRRGEEPLPGQPAVEPPPPTAQPVAGESTTAPVQTVGTPSMELSREVFAYRGVGRDPFLSLLKSGDVRPLPQDVRVTGINFDPRYPQRSVATLQDTTYGKRYVVRVGDVIGRIRIVEVRATEVVAVVEEFGVDRQLVLTIRRRQEDTP